MELFNFTPPTGLRDKEAFPTTPETEEEAREMFMVLFEQLKNKINEIIKEMR